MVWSLRDVFPTVFFFVLNKFSSQRFLALRSNGISFHTCEGKGGLGFGGFTRPLSGSFFFLFSFLSLEYVRQWRQIGVLINVIL